MIYASEEGEMNAREGGHKFAGPHLNFQYVCTVYLRAAILGDTEK